MEKKQHTSTAHGHMRSTSRRRCNARLPSSCLSRHLNPETGAVVRQCWVLLGQNARWNLTRQHVICDIAANQTPRLYFFCGVASGGVPGRNLFCRFAVWVALKPGFWIVVQNVFDPFSAALQTRVPGPELFLQSRSLVNRSAHTRRRGQRTVVRVGCGCVCYLAVGSGRLFHPKHVLHTVGVSETQPYNATDLPRRREFPVNLGEKKFPSLFGNDD